MSDLLFILNFVATAIWNVWPAFLASIVVGVLIRALKLDTAIRHAFSKHAGISILLATAIGAFSPFCSCSVVPVVTGLLISGVPLAPVMSFWIASPTMDPEIFALTVATLGWPLALMRLTATLMLSVGAGFMTLVLTRYGILRAPLLRQQIPAAQPAPEATTMQQPCCDAIPAPQPAIPLVAATQFQTMALVSSVPGATCTRPTCSPAATTQPASAALPWWASIISSLHQLDWLEVGRNVLKQSWSLGRWLLLAFLIEALMTRYVPQAAIAALLGETTPFAVPLAALIGIPLYLNNVSALPIVSGLLAQGMQPGAAIAFLIAGPVTTIPAMTAVWNVVERRVFGLYLGVGLGGAILLGLLANLIL